MGVESLKPANTPTGAVFLSYASQDERAAARIAEALKAAGIEVWFDREELRGGDAWDRQIRTQIHECRLFVPIVSANTEARIEGYFRREWKLAVDRTHDLSERVAFLVPVAIDSTPELKADVPDAFRHVQWTRLPDGETSPGFVERVRKLLSPESSPARAAGTLVPSSLATMQRARTSVSSPSRSKLALLAIGGALAVALTYLVVDKFWLPKRIASSAASTGVTPASQPAVTPEKSIAVLPFADMSEKHDQEYLCDGLAEELISRLARAADLRVIARTSSFQFKGKSEDVRDIAGKLGVANLVEGSIRRSGARVRVNVHLIRAADGAPLWSQSYDREDADALKMQDDIAEAVANSLSVSLKLDSASTPRMGEAYMLLLRGREIADRSGSDSDYQKGLALIEEALRQDPQLGLAWAEASRTRLARYLQFPESGTRDAIRAATIAEAERALKLAPNLAESHLAMARILMFVDWEWTRGVDEMRQALELGPNNATVQRNAYYFATALGRWNEALEHAKRATELDPLNPYNFAVLGDAQTHLFAFSDAEKSYRSVLRLDSRHHGAHSSLAYSLWVQGKRAEAMAENDLEPDEASRLRREALFYQKLGRNEEARKALDLFIEKYGHTRAFDAARLLGDLGMLDEAFRWWNRALSERQLTLGLLECTRDPYLPQVVQDTRFKALLRKMNLPE